jgi:tetratricopeptide (TPR) repeat protein
MGEHDLSYWQTASAVLEALEDRDGAIEASRNAYALRMTPSTGADLGWKLYLRGRDLFRENRIAEALEFLREAGEVWSEDSPWALRADSLIDLCNEFTSVSSGFGEPF